MTKESIFQSEKKLAVAQKNGIVYLYTISSTRKEAIKIFMEIMDDKLKWEYFKRQYGIHCKKITILLENGW